MSGLIVLGDTNIGSTSDLYPAMRIFAAIQKSRAKCDVLSKVNTLNENDRNLLKRARIFHFGSGSLKSEPSRSKLYEAIDFAAEHNTIISYAPQIDLSQWRMRSGELRVLRSPIATADIVQLLPEELLFLTGQSEPEAAAEVLADQGVRLIFVMLNDGVLVQFGREQRMFPSNGICDSDVFFGEMIGRIADAKRPLRQMSTDDIMKWTESVIAFSCK